MASEVQAASSHEVLSSMAGNRLVHRWTNCSLGKTAMDESGGVVSLDNFVQAAPMAGNRLVH